MSQKKGKKKKQFSTLEILSIDSQSRIQYTSRDVSLGERKTDLGFICNFHSCLFCVVHLIHKYIVCKLNSKVLKISAQTFVLMVQATKSLTPET